MVDFSVVASDSELVSDLLWSLGVVAIEERDDSSHRVTLRTSMGDDPENAVARVLSAFPDTTAERILIARSVADTWREHAVATWVNNEVVLVPAWISAPDKCIPIFVEPLDTFVALLRQCTCTTYDIAENARVAVEENVRINKAKDVNWIDGYPSNESDAVLANILAPVLIEESRNISDAVKSGGLLFLSGMRTEQVSRVVEHFAEFVEVDRDEMDGWTAVALQKK